MPKGEVKFMVGEFHRFAGINRTECFNFQGKVSFQGNRPLTGTTTRDDFPTRLFLDPRKERGSFTFPFYDVVFPSDDVFSLPWNWTWAISSFLFSWMFRISQIEVSKSRREQDQVPFFRRRQKEKSGGVQQCLDNGKCGSGNGTVH